MEVLISLGLYTPPNPRLVFGSIMQRPLLPDLPLAAPPTRLGILLTRDFRPKIGPGKYKIEEKTSFIHALDERTRSTRGTMFGASSEPRPPKSRLDRVPSPPRHQADLATRRPVLTQRSLQAQPAPFDQKADRFYDPKQAKDVNNTPGPGNYRPEQCRIRRPLKRSYSFGGTTTVLPSVHVKCLVTNEDICSECEQKPCGDYWENSQHQMCRSCYERLSRRATQYTQFTRDYMATFQKVRDCSDIHQHDGTDAALKLKSESHIRDLQYKEAYMSLYF